MLVDPHVALRHMMARILSQEGPYEVVGEAGSGREALEGCRQCKPDVVIIELVLPELCGREVIRRLRVESTCVRVLVFSGTQNELLIMEALKCRPHGFIEKRDSLDTFLEGLRVVTAGRSYFSLLASSLMSESIGQHSVELTPRECEVLQLVAESRSSKEIAGLLGLARKTVENHRAHLMDKLHLRDTAALTRYAVEHGIVS